MSRVRAGGRCRIKDTEPVRAGRKGRVSEGRDFQESWLQTERRVFSRVCTNGV